MFKSSVIVFVVSATNAVLLCWQNATNVVCSSTLRRRRGSSKPRFASTFFKLLQRTTTEEGKTNYTVKLSSYERVESRVLSSVEKNDHLEILWVIRRSN